VKHSFTTAVRAAGLEDFTFHDLRHTFGTRLAASGADVVKIRELMGHASITTTMRYMHASDSGKRDAIARMAASYAANDCHKRKTASTGPAVSVGFDYAPGMTRTCDLLVRSPLGQFSVNSHLATSFNIFNELQPLTGAPVYTDLGLFPARIVTRLSQEIIPRNELLRRDRRWRLKEPLAAGSSGSVKSA
jgi:hypothetical protein